MGIFDKAKDMLGDAAGELKLPDLGAIDLKSLDMGAIADKAKGLGIDPEQIKGLLTKFTGGDGKLIERLPRGGQGPRLDVDKVKGCSANSRKGGGGAPRRRRAPPVRWARTGGRPACAQFAGFSFCDVGGWGLTDGRKCLEWYVESRESRRSVWRLNTRGLWRKPGSKTSGSTKKQSISEEPMKDAKRVHSGLVLCAPGRYPLVSPSLVSPCAPGCLDRPVPRLVGLAPAWWSRGSYSSIRLRFCLHGRV